MRTHTRKPVEYKTRHHPTTSSTLCRTPHLNNKQNKSTNSIIGRQDHHLTQPCPSEEKQRRKQKLSRNLTLYQAYTNTGPILLLLLLLSRFSHVQFCATPWMAAHQTPPSLGFSRQEHWSGLPFPSPMRQSEK